MIDNTYDRKSSRSLRIIRRIGISTLIATMSAAVLFATLHRAPVLSQTPEVWVHTMVADFSGCGIPNGASVTNIDGGEVRLPALVEDYFDVSSLDTTRWTRGSRPVTIMGGILTVDASWIRSVVSVTQDDLPVPVEGRIRFDEPGVGTGWADFGLGKEDQIPGPSNALFISDDDGNVYANDYQPGTISPQRTEITGFDWTEYQDFRFMLDTNRVDYYVNGNPQVIHTLTTPMTMPMYLWFWGEMGGFPVRADWLRVARYPLNDQYTSCPVDVGRDVSWGTLTWQGDMPGGTSVSFETRSSGDGQSYSSWTPLGAGSEILSPIGRYLQYRISLSTSDPTLSPQVDEVSIAVTNSVPRVDDDSFAVDENSVNGTSVGTVLASDPDAWDTLTHGITGGNTGDAFAINGSSGEITVNDSSALDHETTPSFNLTVVVTDTGNLTDSASITITVNDVNEAPTDIGLDSTEVDENEPVDTLVGNLSTVDQDSADSHTYSLVDTVPCPGPDSGSFNIDDAELRTDATFDYEATDTYTICVRTDDGNGGIYDKQFIITVNDVNDAPTDIDLDSTDVDENEPVDTLVGNLSTVDQDSTDSHIYSLTDTVPCPGPDIGSFNVDAAELRTGATFDYEATDTYTICVRTDDGSGGTYDEQFIIDVNDVNEAPMATDDSGPGFGTEKDMAFTTASVLANDEDPDVADVIAFDSYDDSSVLGILNWNGSGIFDYDPNGQFASLDQGDEAYEIFTYVISDTAGLTDTATVTITVTGKNTPPTANDDSGEGFETDEDSVFTTDDVLSNDTDVETPGNLAVYAYEDSGMLGLLGDNGDGTFNYDPNGQLEYLGMGQHAEEVFTYVVTDGVLTDTATVSITVTGLNDPPVADDDTFIVDENSATGRSVGTVSASDPDAGDSLTYGIMAGNTGDAFAINGSTGEITVNDTGALDSETTPSFDLTVVVTDTGGLTGTAVAQVVIYDVDPTAEFTADPRSGDEPLTVVFTDTTTSYDGITAWGWDLDGDGSPDATIRNPTFEYTATGTYTVTLTVWEGDGDSDTATKAGYISVGDADPYKMYLPMVKLRG